MSELNNVALSSSGFVGIEKESSVTNSLQEIATQPKIAEFDGQAIAPQAEKKEGELSPAQVKETVQEVNDILHNMNRNLSFTVDEQLGQSVILVKDSESDEVIRQIPSEELVVLRKKMDDVVGILFDTKV